MKKVKKVETYRDKFFTTVVYEYRGKQYEVTYANGHNVCCSPAWIQHRDSQAEIDKMIDVSNVSIESQPMSEQLDEVWDMLGW